MKKIFMAMAFLALWLPVMASGSTCPPYTPCADNLIVNGDFEAGNLEFATDYIYVSSTGDYTLGPPKTYTVGTNPFLYHKAWASFGDHTSGTGNMMIVNATDSTLDPPPYGDIVWQQENVPVCPNTEYAFSYWIALSYADNPPLMQVLINGKEIGIYDALTTPATPLGQWVKVSYLWNSGASTSATIKFVDQRPVYGGDDYALDDISLCPSVRCFEDETGWAAGTRYVTKGNWATYTPYVADTTVPLYAGQTMPAGTVAFSAPANSMVTITITLNPGWYFEDVYENVKIQDYATIPPGRNPSPGRFTNKGYATESPFQIEVPVKDFYGVHVDLLREVCCPPPVQ